MATPLIARAMVSKKAPTTARLPEDKMLKSAVAPLPGTPPNPRMPAGVPKAMPGGAPSDISKATADLTKSTQYNAVTRGFDERKGVEGRIGGIISKNSPLMQIAATRAAQGANARGLRNSSMAVQAGQQAVMESALPIASTDAQLYQQRDLANLGYANDAAKTNAGMRMNVGLEGMKLGEGARQFDSGLGFEGEKLQEQRRQFDFTGNLNVRKLDQENQQFIQGLDLEKSKLDTQRDQFAKQLGLDVRQLDLQRDQLTTQQQQFLKDLDFKKAQLDQQAKQATDQLTMQKTIAQMDADSRLKLAEVEAGYKNDIASNENISNAWGTMMNAINDIQNNPDLDAATKKSLIQNNINSFGKFSEFWKKLGGGSIDITDLLKFGVTDTGAKPGDKPKPPDPNDKDGDGKPDNPFRPPDEDPGRA